MQVYLCSSVSLLISRTRIAKHRHLVERRWRHINELARVLHKNVLYVFPVVFLLFKDVCDTNTPGCLSVCTTSASLAESSPEVALADAVADRKWLNFSAPVPGEVWLDFFVPRFCL